MTQAPNGLNSGVTSTPPASLGEVVDVSVGNETACAINLEKK